MYDRTVVNVNARRAGFNNATATSALQEMPDAPPVALEAVTDGLEKGHHLTMLEKGRGLC